MVLWVLVDDQYFFPANEALPVIRQERIARVRPSLAAEANSPAAATMAL